MLLLTIVVGLVNSAVSLRVLATYRGKVIIKEVQIPVKQCPGKKIWIGSQVMGSNPCSSKRFVLLKSLFKWICMITLPCNLYVKNERDLYCINCLICRWARWTVNFKNLIQQRYNNDNKRENFGQLKLRNTEPLQVSKWEISLTHLLPKKQDTNFKASAQKPQTRDHHHRNVMTGNIENLTWVYLVRSTIATSVPCRLHLLNNI